MIVLTVLSYNGAPAAGLSSTFDELGGTVGRADTNQLVLPDPERTISRVHARVVCVAGRYAVVDNGSNPIAVNGQGIGSGREHPLAPGDKLQIGGYVLVVTEAAAAVKSNDPFADLFGDAAMGLAGPAAAGPAAAAAARQPAPGPAAWVPTPPAAVAPWAAPFAAPAAAPFAAPFAAPLTPGFIPDDWDPFAPRPARAPAPAAPPATTAMGTDLLLDLPTASSDSLDALFGLAGASATADPFATQPTDPLGGGAAQAFQSQPNTAGDADPLRAFAQPVALAAVSRPDHVSELNLPMSLPQPAAPVGAGAGAVPFHAPVAATLVVPAVRAPAPAALPAGAVFSWDNPPADGRVVTLPGQKPSAARAAAQNVAAAPMPAATASSPTAPAAPGELLAALLRGLDTPGLRLQQLDADTMLLLGQLLRESLRGTVELLVARSALKREMRAQMTMIVARENNPLKFSPTVEVALQHLLGPPTKGFMPPTQAVRDATDDLRAHQLGVIAGMRAALDGVLQRFDPAQLEAKLTRKSAISSLIPAARKARLWELFQELFTQLQSEATDDFDELFGKAFLRAYEDQLDRLHGAPGP